MILVEGSMSPFHSREIKRMERLFNKQMNTLNEIKKKVKTHSISSEIVY